MKERREPLTVADVFIWFKDLISQSINLKNKNPTPKTTDLILSHQLRRQTPQLFPKKRKKRGKKKQKPKREQQVTPPALPNKKQLMPWKNDPLFAFSSLKLSTPPFDYH